MIRIKNPDKISVIIPTYNSMPRIVKTIQSVKNNYHKNIDLIIVDDGSTDGTFEYLSRADIRDVLIKRCDDNSGGPNRGRNYGIAMASSEWITFLDHDDEIMPDKLIRQLEAAKKYNVDVVSCNYQNVSPRGSVEIKSRFAFYSKEFGYPRFISGNEGSLNFIPGCLLLRTKKCPLFEHKDIDYDWAMKVLAENDVVVVDNILLKRNISGSNLSLNIGYKERTYEYFKNFVDNKKYQHEYKEAFREGLKYHSQTLARNYYYHGSWRKCVKMLLRSKFTYKNIGLLVTCPFPFLRRYVLKRFDILGKAKQYK